MLWSSSLPALVVRFLTRRFIGDYERNAGNLYSREVQVDGEQAAIQVQDTPGVDVSSLFAMFPNALETTAFECPQTNIYLG